MNIILEGPDNAGKTTLAFELSEATGMTIHPKEGRPANRTELLMKLRKYEGLDGVIIDRHPIISQSVYGLIRGDAEIPEDFLDRFFAKDDLIIYCRCVHKGLDGHEPSPTDTPEHLRSISEHQQKILDTYDNWAAICANIIYSRYEQLPRVVAMVQAVLREFHHERG